MEAVPPTPPGLFLLVFQEAGILQTGKKGSDRNVEVTGHGMKERVVGIGDRLVIPVAQHGKKDTVRHEQIGSQGIRFLFLRGAVLPNMAVQHRFRMVQAHAGQDLMTVGVHLPQAGMDIVRVQENGVFQRREEGPFSLLDIDIYILLQLEDTGQGDAAVHAEAVLHPVELQVFRGECGDIQPESFSGARPGDGDLIPVRAACEDILPDAFHGLPGGHTP